MCWKSPTAGSRSSRTRADAETHRLRREPTERRMRRTKEMEEAPEPPSSARSLVAGLDTVGPASAGSSFEVVRMWLQLDSSGGYPACLLDLGLRLCWRAGENGFGFVRCECD